MKTPAAALFATLLLVGTAGAQIEPPAAGLGNVATTPVTIGDGSATSTLTADVSGTDCSMVYDGTTWDFSCPVSASSFAADQHATDGASLVLLEGVDDGSNSFTLKVPDSGLSASATCTTEADGDIPGSCLGDRVRSMWFAAAAASSDGANCATPAEVTVGSWGKQFSAVCTDNDGSVITWSAGFPDGWDAGTFTVELHYVQDAADTSALNVDVSARCVGAGETPAAYGTEVAIDDAAVTGSDALDTTTSAAVTAAGTCVAGDYIQFQAAVDATGTTTAMATLHFLGAKLEYTRASDD